MVHLCLVHCLSLLATGMRPFPILQTANCVWSSVSASHLVGTISLSLKLLSCAVCTASACCLACACFLSFMYCSCACSRGYKGCIARTHKPFTTGGSASASLSASVSQSVNVATLNCRCRGMECTINIHERTAKSGTDENLGQLQCQQTDRQRNRQPRV